ncbi:MAG: hypothetical protein ACJ8ES_23245 [Xanthobacteraceae bacterium]
MSASDPAGAITVESLARAEWLKHGSLAELLSVLNRHGEEARAIGGAVRDSLLGKDPVEIDVATTALPPEVIRRVVDKQVKELAAQLVEKKIEIVLEDSGREWLAENGFDRTMGARPMARLVQNEVKKPLAEKILFGELRHGGVVRVRAADGKLALAIEPAPAPVAA